MKKIFSIILLSAALFSTTSCVQEEDLLFDKSAAERLNEASDLYSGRLVDASDGWVFEYYPSTSISEDNYIKGIGYLMLVKFNPDYSVKVGMKNAFSGNNYKEDVSVWEVITDNGPVLSFNSFNQCLHAFSNPEDILGTSDNETGKGLEGDYEFVMVDVPEGGEYMTLKGKKRGAYSRLTRLAPGTDFEEYITDVQAFQKSKFVPTAPNYNILTIDGERYKMIIPDATKGGELGSVMYWPYDSDSTFTKKYESYLITRHPNGDSNEYTLRFRSPIGKDNKVQCLTYNEQTKTFYDAENPNTELVGEPVGEFVEESLNNEHKYQMSSSSPMSDDFGEVMKTFRQSYSAIKYTLNNIQLAPAEDNTMLLIVNFRTNTNSSGNVRFKYSSTLENGKLTLKYIEPYNSAAEKQYNAVTGLPELIRMFERSFTFTSDENPFNLSVVRFCSDNTWVSMNYVK